MKDLTGRWIGRYDYASRVMPAVAFEVELVEDGGDLTGMITEANGFRSDKGATLRARLIGGRNGAEVKFAKYYIGFDQDDDPHYAGTVNDALTRITGLWHFPTVGGAGGRFVMTRERVQVAVRARRMVAVR
ncbi:hypothetical protein [Loktanella sp. M215]|uniref:hypothetical protein n=1 Tax=Loktanella sp. M215 TaxID=2675431 RepID=UPI001F3903F9|nr:hypothetical protein [Loktanella sp. M215]MCF7697739.1 hypothetical protein [Loktanella sp. M215]